MASTFTIVAYGDDARQLPRVVNAALDEVDRIDRLMSHYKSDSPLSLINREAARRPVTVEPELFHFIEECVRYSRESGGAFDITVGPLMKAWGFFRGEGRIPGAAELAEARSKVGYQHLILNSKDGAIRFDRTGIELDLGGIAKGYAVDRVAGILRSHGIERALINSGGSTLYGMGAPPNSEAWEVKIRDPIDHQKSAATVYLRDRALSVSGSDEKFVEIGGARYSHIMDPRTGQPAGNMLSVAVLTDSGTAGDALDNVFYVEGVERSRGYLKKFRGIEVYFFLPQAGKKWRMVHLRN